jgi:hypothetical protein
VTIGGLCAKRNESSRSVKVRDNIDELSGYKLSKTSFHVVTETSGFFMGRVAIGGSFRDLAGGLCLCYAGGLCSVLCWRFVFCVMLVDCVLCYAGGLCSVLCWRFVFCVMLEVCVLCYAGGLCFVGCLCSVLCWRFVFRVMLVVCMLCYAGGLCSVLCWRFVFCVMLVVCVLCYAYLTRPFYLLGSMRSSALLYVIL